MGTDRKVIVNELLCFTLNKMKDLSLDAVVRLCAKVYSNDEIFQAKKILFDSVQDNKHRFCQRKGDNRGLEDMRDIAVVLYSTEIRNISKFTAENLSNLPPLSAGDCDVIKIWREVDSMKQSVKLLSESQSTLTALVQDKLTPSIPSTHNCSEHCHSKPETQNDVAESAQHEDSSYMVLDYTSCSGETADCPDRSIASSLSVRNDEVFARRMQDVRVEDHTPHQSPKWNTQRGRQHQRNERVRNFSPQPRRFQKQKDYIIGSEPSTVIVATQRSRDRKQDGNSAPSSRTVTGVFATRLSSRTTSKQIETHIWRQTGLTVRAEALVTKYDTYRSFYIPCDNNKRNIIIDASVWPKGVMVKPFYS
jgi:hypothetical protein